MSSTMDREVAAALRAALVEHVRLEATTRRRRLWRRSLAAGAGLALIGGGVAVARSAHTVPPGADEITGLSAPVTVTRTGTSTVELGVPPTGATDIELRLTCLTAGTFRFSDGASMRCSNADIGGNGRTTYAIPLRSGQHSTTIRTDRPAARWRLTASYSQHTPTAWATNASGQTYGVGNDDGQDPDLLMVRASNGRIGYAYSRELWGPSPATPKQALEWQREDEGKTHTIEVYESDGTTQVGVLVLQGVDRTK